LYRARDAERSGHPLRRLVELLGAELDRVEAAILSLADDHFVERASDDGLRLLADLFGAELLHDDLRANRGVVASSVHWRRRRGTASTLEQVLTVTSGWSAEVDESFRSLLQTQDLRYLVPWRARTAVLWDPIATSDPLSRNAPAVALPPLGASPGLRGFVERHPDESLDAALRRMGRADAGRHAASPRTFDALGWSRPDVAVIRTDRLAPLEIEEMDLGEPIAVPSARSSEPLRGMILDPLGRDVPLLWRKPLDTPGTIETLTAIHEPASETLTSRSAATLLTPTALAADGDGALRGGALELRIDGVQLLGPTRVDAPNGPLEFAPFASNPVLRLADTRRPGPGDQWIFKVIARQPGGDTVMAAQLATHASTNTVTLAPQASTALGGATVTIRARRLTGAGARRDNAGQWSLVSDVVRLGVPLGAATVLGTGADATIVRPELLRVNNELRLATCSPIDLVWQPLTLVGEVPEPAIGCLVVSEASGDLLLLTPESDSDGESTHMALHRVTVAGDEGVVTRLVTNGLQPPARRGAAATLTAGRLYLHGGVDSTLVLGDLWSIATDGSESDWTPHLPRNPQPRQFATLLARDERLWLLGGEAKAGKLEPSVWFLSTTARRPRWEPLPALPFAANAPGVLCAQHTAAGLSVIAWADSTRPRSYTLGVGASVWETGPLERDAPNPPAIGEVVMVGDEVVVCGAPPLPASELVFAPAGEAVLIHLPALDLVPAGLDVGEDLLDDEANNPGIPETAHVTFHVAGDGSTFVVGAGDEQLHAREGGSLHASLAARTASVPRFGIPERLARHYYLLRQRSLERWDTPMHVVDDGVIGLDPRLGRVLLPGNVSHGRISASYLVGRPAAIGAGFLPVNRDFPALWREPDVAPPIPPEKRESVTTVVAWVDPLRAGHVLLDGERAVPIVADLERAAWLMRNDVDSKAPLIGVLRSSTLPSARFTANVGTALSIVATDFGATPLVRADSSDVSLAFYPSRGGSSDSELWLGGLWLEGRLELALGNGQVDLRHCTFGVPGSLGVRIPGAEHDSPLTRRVLPDVDVELRLYGCVVAGLEVPPWVRVVAAGCTFDAGSRTELALRAAGARVHLRHCTVHGQTLAGELYASSCVFAGSVRVDRRDQGWIRHSLIGEGGAPPRAYRSHVVSVALSSIAPESPLYLALADNNGATLLQAG